LGTETLPEHGSPQRPGTGRTDGNSYSLKHEWALRKKATKSLHYQKTSRPPVQKIIENLFAIIEAYNPVSAKMQLDIIYMA